MDYLWKPNFGMNLQILNELRSVLRFDSEKQETFDPCMCSSTRLDAVLNWFVMTVW